MGSLLHVRPKPGGRRRGVDTGAGRSCGEGSEGGTSEPTPTQPQPDVATARGTWAGGGAVGQSRTFSPPTRNTGREKEKRVTTGISGVGGEGETFLRVPFFYSFDL